MAFKVQKINSTTNMTGSISRIKSTNIPKWTTIGKKCQDDPDMMFPNPNFLTYFSDAELPDDQGRDVRSSCLRIGTSHLEKLPSVNAHLASSDLCRCKPDCCSCRCDQEAEPHRQIVFITGVRCFPGIFLRLCVRLIGTRGMFSPLCSQSCVC